MWKTERRFPKFDGQFRDRDIQFHDSGYAISWRKKEHNYLALYGLYIYELQIDDIP